MIDPAQEQGRQRLTGIALMSGAVLCFAILDCTAKYLGQFVGVVDVLWARYTFAFVLALILFNPISRPGLMRTSRPLLQVGRGFLLLGSSLFNFLALRYMQLDEQLAILFAAPFMVAALAGPLLGEWIGWRRWTAIGVGFVGVLVITRPGVGAMHWAVALSFVSAICYAFYSIATRLLARSDSSETTLFYSNLVGAIVVTPVLPLVWSPPDSLFLLLLMVQVGAFGALGHYLLIAAHRHTPASTLSPFMYTQLIWVIMLGYLVFGDLPNRWTLAGVGIVIASGLYLLNRERKVRGAVAPVDPG